MKLLLTFLLLGLQFIIKCQSLHDPVAAGYISLSAYSKKITDPFSFTGNIAALSKATSTTAGIYSEKPFLLDALNLVTGVITFATGNGNFGVQADYFGFKNYNETQLGIGYSRALGNKLDIGMKCNYYSLRIREYGTASAINFELGFIAHLTEYVNVGFSAYNPVGGKFMKTNTEKLRSVYKFGIGYDATDVFFVSAEIIKEEDMPVDVKGGIQYNYSKRLFVRAGIRTLTAIAYAGAGYSWGIFRLDVTASYHSPLGFSPGIMLLMNLKKSKT